MGRNIFTNEDLRQIRNHGLTVEEVQKHLDLFKMPPPYLKLVRPCTAGDGIQVFDQEKMQTLIETYESESPKRVCLKFVPASGVASRMFKTPLWFLNQGKEIMRDIIVSKARSGQRDALELLKFMDGVKQFAFFNDLKSVMLKNESNIDTLLKRGQFTEIIRFLLNESGLNYASLPKGLLKFHEYPEKSRTPFEEHLVEAASYVADQNKECRLHFTVSREHLGGFEGLLERVRSVYEQKFNALFHVTFSMQKKSTDTLAVGLDNRPFREANGTLLFRPGGHGALNENLNDLKGDIVFIKNIDNVVPDRLKPETFKWKKILGGALMATQNRVFSYVERLSSPARNASQREAGGGEEDDLFLSEVLVFLQEELSQAVPASIENASTKEKKIFLIEALNRPIRVCGMVKNVGEPGGGPFWVKGQTEESSLQIVEMAQIDPDSKAQQDILSASTHFNPVDLVCGVRDWQGRPFDLRKYVDPNAVFIAQKSKDGKDLKALEHPGLWNGAMAGWVTIFVQVPVITFNPVKRVNDLLRREHQPG